MTANFEEIVKDSSFILKNRIIFFSFFIFVFFSLLTVVYFKKVLPIFDDKIVSSIDDFSSDPRIKLTSNQKQKIFDVKNSNSELIKSVAVNSDYVVKINNFNFSDPLIVTDCQNNSRPCLIDENCKVLCKNVSDFICNKNTLTCEPVGVSFEDQVDNNNSSNDNGLNSHNCNIKIGEYALLQGYNELGIAQWNCVQIYPGWQIGIGTTYCEGGTMDIDTRVRPPSYLDCKCPVDTVRMVYKKSILGQEHHGFPHCVKNHKLFNLDYEIL